MTEVMTDNAPLSETQAAAMIAALDAPAETVEAEKPAEIAEAETTETVEDQPEVIEGAAEPEAEVGDDPDAGEDEPVDEAAVSEPIDPPHWWDAEAKAAFKNIPNTPAARAYALQMQKMIADSEAKREAVTQKVKSEALTAKQEASKAAETMRGLLTRLDSTSHGIEAEYQAKYGQIDFNDHAGWEAYKSQDPEGFSQWMAQYQLDTMRLNQSRTERAEAQRTLQEQFVREQSEKLQELAPELAGNEKTLRALGDYLSTTGIPAEAMKEASAEELVILNKARLWDELQTKAAASANAPKPKAPPVKSVPPVAAQNTGSFKQRQAADAVTRLKRSGSEDDAVAAILALGL